MLCYISLFSGCWNIIKITQRSEQRFLSWATKKLITEPTEILSVFTRDFRESQWLYLRRKTRVYWLLGISLINFQIIIKVLPWTSEPHVRPTKSISFIRDSWRYQFGWIFGINPKGGRSFSIQFILQIWTFIQGIRKVLRKKSCNMIFWKWRGGGPTLCEIFPKISWWYYYLLFEKMSL